MKKIISRTLYSLFSLLLVAVVLLFLAPFLPIKDNIAIKIVKSGSMEPAIQTGSVVIIKPSSEYGVGDVITFGEDNPTSYPTTHRIIALDQTGNSLVYKVKGDANEEPDLSPVSPREVIGKVIFTLPHAGYVIDFARQPIGFILLIALPAALVILNEFVDLVREIRRIVRRKKDPLVPKHVSKMDDMLRPVEKTSENEIHKSKNSSLIANLIMFVVSGFVFTQAGATASYFSDMENSLGNAMSAISLSISASATPSESHLSLSTTSTINAVVTPTPVGFPNEYHIAVEKISGSDNFCQSLVMASTSTPPFVHQGPILNFLTPPTIFAGEWVFDVSIAPEATGINTGDVCTLDFVYTARSWLAEEGIHGGYSDVERVTLTFYADETTGEVNNNFIEIIETQIIENIEVESATTTPEESVVIEETLDDVPPTITVTVEPDSVGSDTVEAVSDIVETEAQTE